jgi:transcriptional regulator with XRE-family HTH domain
MGTLGQNIVKARVDKRMKQKDLMEKADLSQRYLSALEHDKVDPRLSILVRLAKALGVTLDSLAGLHEESQRSPAADPARHPAESTTLAARLGEQAEVVHERSSIAQTPTKRPRKAAKPAQKEG